MRSDPLRIREAARALHVSDRVLAMTASLLLTAGISVLSLVLTQSARWLQLLAEAKFNIRHRSQPPLLQPLWTALTDADRPFAAFTTSALFPAVLSMLFYFAACMPYALLDLLGVRRFKFQPDATQRPDGWRQTLGLTAKHHALLILPGLSMMLRSRGPWLYKHAPPLCWEDCDGKVLFPAEAPRVDELAAHVAVCFVVFDACYAFWHWLHHRSPPLYKHIHSLHHEYHAPFAWVTQYEHALELLPVSLWSMSVPITLGVHPLTEWVWLMAAIQASVDAHSGYSLGAGPLLKRLLPAWGGSKYHDDHHKLPRSNFQPFFGYFDKAAGNTYEAQVKHAAE